MWEPTTYSEEISNIVDLVEKFDQFRARAHHDQEEYHSLQTEFYHAWAALEKKQRDNWPGTFIVANQIERRLRKMHLNYCKYVSTTDSVYFICNNRVLRVSDHINESGGFNKSTGSRYKAADVNLTPHAGIGCKEALQNFLTEDVLLSQEY